MAGATTFLAATSMAYSTGKGIHDIYSGRRQVASAEEKIEKYNRQDLKNAYAGMSVPTRGAELAKEQTMQTQAEVSHILGSRGTQGAMGGAFSLADSTRESMEGINQQLTESEFKMTQLMAEEEARIRGMQERREEKDLQGLGAQRAYGYAKQDAGASRIVSTAASGANLAMEMENNNDGGNSDNENFDFNEPFTYGRDPVNFRVKMPNTDIFPKATPWDQRVSLKK